MAGLSRYRLPETPSLLVLSSRDLAEERSAEHVVDVASEAIRLTADVADYVVFDAPPLGEMTDAVRLAATVDALILVVRLGSTTRGSLGEARTQLASIGIAPTGCIVVGLPDWRERLRMPWSSRVRGWARNDPAADSHVTSADWLKFGRPSLRSWVTRRHLRVGGRSSSERCRRGRQARRGAQGRVAARRAGVGRPRRRRARVHDQSPTRSRARRSCAIGGCACAGTTSGRRSIRHHRRHHDDLDRP